MIIIVTDTTAGLQKEITSNLGIIVLPQIVIFGDKSYRDDTELNSQEFLELLQNSAQLPKTSAPSPQLYHPIFKEAIKNGDTLICIHPSSKVSGTVRSAQVAAQDFPEAKIHIIDSQTIACNLGSLVLYAQKLIQTTDDIDLIINKINNIIPHQRIYFLVDTLKYLHKGGRIGGAKKLVGEILQVKPILTMHAGQVEPYEQERTKRKAIGKLIDIAKEQCPPDESSNLCVMHADAYTDALELSSLLKNAINIKDIPIYEIPPAIIVHAGPKVIGLGFFQKTG